MPEPMVRIQGANKSFRGAHVVREVSFDLAPGQFLGLAGENGAGKTTLIKCMLDLCSLDSGSILIHGISSERPEGRAGLAFLPEQFTPPWFLTGREFVRLMLKLAPARRGEDSMREDSTRAVLAEIGLDTRMLDLPVRAYSKGMTQKLGLAACFLAGKDLYVLDEPFSGLDPGARAGVKGILRRLKDKGATLLFTSHSLADVEEICDHMVVLHRGSVEFRGPPADLRDRFGESSLERAFLKCIMTGSHG